MTNGEKIQTILNIDRDCTEVHGENGTMTFTVTQDFWNAEYKEPTNTIDYRRAFKTACDLLNGDILYGVDTDKIYELMMQKDGVVSNSSYEEYILNHLQELDQGQYASSSENPNKSEIPTSSTTKNDLAQERYQDLIEYFGSKEVAKTILEDRKEFKAWLERLRWNVKRADELAREIEQLKGATKNNLAVDCVDRREVINQIFYSTDNSGDVVLGSALMERIKKLPLITPTSRESVDCIDRQATLDAIIKRLGIKNETYLLEAERAIYQQILAMPSVTPQLSSELEKNSKKLEKNFGELDCISRKAVIDELKRYFHDEYYQRTSIQDCRDCFIEDVLNHLPSVTPIRPKGHWIYKKFDERTGITNVHICSKCGCPLASPYKSFCSACGSDNREVKI